jgi:putative ATPase
MAPKSNTALTTYARAREAVQKHGPLPVPMHLRNAPTKLMKSLGYGGGYQYPHDFEGNYVVENYLPEGLRAERFFEPSGNGYEQKHKERIETIRSQRAPKEPGEDG